MTDFFLCHSPFQFYTNILIIRSETLLIFYPSTTYPTPNSPLVVKGFEKEFQKPYKKCFTEQKCKF